MLISERQKPERTAIKTNKTSKLSAIKKKVERGDNAHIRTAWIISAIPWKPAILCAQSIKKVLHRSRNYDSCPSQVKTKEVEYNRTRELAEEHWGWWMSQHGQLFKCWVVCLSLSLVGQKISFTFLILLGFSLCLGWISLASQCLPVCVYVFVSSSFLISC